MNSWKIETRGLRPQRTTRVMMPIDSKITGVFTDSTEVSVSFVYKNNGEVQKKELRLIALYVINENSTEAKEGESILPIGVVELFGRHYVAFEITGFIED